MNRFDSDLCLKYFRELIAIDSTTSQFREIQDHICGVLDGMGFPYHVTRKGGVIAELGGEGRPLCVTAHLDDIGLMVRKINPDGTLNVCPVGGLRRSYSVGENVRVHNRDGRVFTGCVCRVPNSVHVTEDEIGGTLPDFRSNVAVVLDEDVKTADDTRALGIETGDMIAIEPRFTVSNGYIKSRFVDDKALCAVLLCAADAIREGKITPGRRVLAYFSAYEEIGHGTSWCPPEVEDMLALDIAPTGPDQTSDEHKVTIFAKDSRFPYHWEMTNEVRRAAIGAGVDYVMDVFTPHYGTDDDATILAGHDIRHAAIGPGTSNSHGYERTHIEGLRQTFGLLAAVLEKKA